MGKGTPGSFEILFLSAAVCHYPAWPAVGIGICQQGVLARLGEASVSEPVGQWEAWCCPALLCPPLFSYPGYLSTLSRDCSAHC